MKELCCDVHIVGGGLIGVASGYALANLGFKVLISEKKPKHSQILHKKDTRTIAISEGTKKFLNEINVWEKISRFAQPIKNIQVIDRAIKNQINFDNNRRESNLGYIVNNNKVLDIFYNELGNIKNLNVLNNENFNKIENIEDSILLYSNRYLINSNLLISADGKRSAIRNYLKTPIFKKNYKKNALVLTFTHTEDHNKTAYEFFYKKGPLAILPMKNINNKFASSIVWTNDKEYLNNIFNQNETNIINLLNETTRGVIGRVDKIITKQMFPLSAHLNTKFYENRTVYVGDSAHSFHPIAGQGWNLGMKDVKALYQISKKYRNLGIEIGDGNFCKEYNKETFFEAYRLYQITDKLDKIFQKDNIYHRALRSIGIKFIERNKFIKEKISDFAMGLN